MKIKYYIFGDHAFSEWSEKAFGDSLELVFDEGVSGLVYIGNVPYRVEKSRVKVPVSALGFGDTYPILETTGVRMTLDGVRRTASGLIPLRPSAEMLYPAFVRALSMLGRVDKLAEEVKALKELCMGKPILE